DRRIWGYHVGGPMLIVYSSSPVDPSAERARSPHPVWGTLWQELAKDIPRDWHCTLQRVPSPATVCGNDARAWNWLCPGRAGAPCGRLTRNLYLPLPCFTI